MLWQLQHNAGYLRDGRLRKFWKFGKKTVLRAVERTDRVTKCIHGQFFQLNLEHIRKGIRFCK